MRAVRKRRGEIGFPPQRTERYFSAGGEWFFYCRGGETRGPFDNKRQAEDALAEFLQEIALVAEVAAASN